MTREEPLAVSELSCNCVLPFLSRNHSLSQIGGFLEAPSIACRTVKDFALCLEIKLPRICKCTPFRILEKQAEAYLPTLPLPHGLEKNKQLCLLWEDGSHADELLPSPEPGGGKAEAHPACRGATEPASPSGWARLGSKGHNHLG